MPVASWVKDIVGPSPIKIGQTVMRDGRMVKIIAGRYWGEHGISNWWEWREIRADGSLGAIERGYWN
jgi:hypothetical protein